MCTDLGPGLLVLSGFSPRIGKRQTGDIPRDHVGGPALVLPTGFTGGKGLGPATGRAGEKALGPLSGCPLLTAPPSSDAALLIPKALTPFFLGCGIKPT